MKRVTGIGGVFFKCKDPEATKQWYERHLGIPASKWGHSFQWSDGYEGTENKGQTTWSPFSDTTKYFGEGPQEFMVNYRVADLKALLDALRDEGVAIVGELQEYDYGKFAHIVDCDGRRVELWEPVDEALTE